MNKKFKTFITAAISITSLISSMTAIPVGAAEENTSALISETSTENGADASYTGNIITPNIALYDAGVQLVKGTDYDLAYENNINVGTATIIVTFKGNYTGERRVQFNILAKALTQGDVTFTDISDQTYTGSEITPEPTIKYGDVTLIKDKDYTLVYENNLNVGTATVTTTFTGNYSGSAVTTFEIVPDTLDNTKINFSEIDRQTYTGSEITPEPTITYGDVTLIKDKDYTLVYENNLNVGTATVTTTFTGNYSGSAVTTFEIVPDTLDNTKINFSEIDRQTYTGSEITPEPTITYNGVTLVKDTDYTLSYTNNIHVGAAIIDIAFIGNYAGTANTEFEITPKSVNESNITISVIPDQTYTGSEITPEPVVADITR